MPDAPQPLRHPSFTTKDDGALRKEAQQHLAATPALQVVAELLVKLRGSSLPWWTPDVLRGVWDARTRLGWYRERADLRQEITTSLTGLPQKAARKKEPEFQAELIDSVIDDGDITTQQFDGAFDPRDLAVYGAAAEIWVEIMARLPWSNDASVEKEFVAWWIEALLTEKSSLGGMTRTPILTPWQVRSAIDARVWQTHVPVDVRVAIDAARIAQEKARPDEAFHARHELTIAKPEILAKHIPLDVLRPVFVAAGLAMGFDAETAVAAKMASAASAPESPSNLEAHAQKGAPVKKGGKRASAMSEPPVVDDDQWATDEKRRSVRPAR